MLAIIICIGFLILNSMMVKGSFVENNNWFFLGVWSALLIISVGRAIRDSK